MAAIIRYNGSGWGIAAKRAEKHAAFGSIAMFSRLITSGLVIAILGATGSLVHAQNRGGTSAFGGNSGMSAGSFNTSMGGGGFGSSSFGSGGFGGSRFGSSRTGSSGFGSSGFGGSPFGNSGFNTGQGGNRAGQGGQQGFIGRDGADMQATFNQSGNNNQLMQNLNRMLGGGGNQGRNRNRGQNNNQQSQNEKPPVTVRLEVAFDRPRDPLRLTGENIGLRLRKILDEHSITQPEVSVESGVVVLRGTAASESERLVLEKLIAIEPGVREVQNLMTVAQVPSESTLPVINN